MSVNVGPEELGLDPDQTCMVCGETRENHGDKNHQFNGVDDTLIPINRGPARRQEPPRERTRSLGPDEPRSTPEARALARLVEILAGKTISFDGVNRPILDSKDIIKIFADGAE